MAKKQTKTAKKSSEVETIDNLKQEIKELKKENKELRAKKKTKGGTPVGKSGMKYNNGTVVMDENASRISDQNYIKNLPTNLEFTKRYENDIDRNFMKNAPSEEVEADEIQDVYKEIEQGAYGK